MKVWYQGILLVTEIWLLVKTVEQGSTPLELVI